MSKFFFLIIAGGIGALLRYSVSLFFLKYTNTNFPLGVLLVNILGSFLFGLIWALSEDKGIIGPEVRLVILVGFLGSFTTFSTFAFDNITLISNGQIGYFIVNILLNNLLGILFIYLGFKISKLV